MASSSTHTAHYPADLTAISHRSPHVKQCDRDMTYSNQSQVVPARPPPRVLVQNKPSLSLTLCTQYQLTSQLLLPNKNLKSNTRRTSSPIIRYPENSLDYNSM
jgi:hypothetical protein